MLCCTVRLLATLRQARCCHVSKFVIIPIVHKLCHTIYTVYTYSEPQRCRLETALETRLATTQVPHDILDVYTTALDH